MFMRERNSSIPHGYGQGEKGYLGKQNSGSQVRRRSQYLCSSRYSPESSGTAAIFSSFNHERCEYDQFSET